jgi:AAA domain (dynein-related subfamily)
MATPKQTAFYADLAWAYATSAVVKEHGPHLDDSLGTRMASRRIDAVVSYAKSAWPWRPMSRQSVVAEAAYVYAIEHGRPSFGRRDFDALESILRPVLQTPVLTFTRNGRFGREPLAMVDAIVQLRRAMSMVQTRVNERLAEHDRDERESIRHDDRDELSAAIDEAFTDSDDTTTVSDDNAARSLYERIERLREFANARGLASLDSMRVQLDARKALDAGCPADGIIASIVADWSDESVRQAGEKRFNYAAWRADERAARTHGVWPYVERLIKAGVPVYLHGPAGTGKSSAARLAAENLGLDYHELNLAGAMASAIRGRDTLQGFVETPFIHAYRDGGVLVMEEIDSAHPNVLTAINNAVANGHWANEAMDAVIARHGEFRIVATANTLGTGATKEFSGRMRLDGATLDRFRVGRVKVDLDKTLERELLGL